MTVTRVIYHNWRNIGECDVPLGSGINVLWGMNAQGKSNILEGIYYFARGRSFRGAHDKELIRFGCDFSAASLEFLRDGYENTTKLEAMIPRSGKKKLLRNGAPLSSSAEMMGSFRAVLFCPANLSIVTGGPLERRTFLDIAISQLSPTYLSYLKRYTKLLGERNALLKRAQSGEPFSYDEIDVYSSELARCGAWIASYRNEYVRYLGEAVSRYFAGMTGGAEIPTLTYTSHALYDGIPEPLLNIGDEPDSSQLHAKLTSHIEREIAAGVTLWGIHKDDVELLLNCREAKLYASQGQQRSIVLSMKLAEAEIAQSIGGEYPVILLDDVFSELDENRRRFILDSLGAETNGAASRRQIIVTSCEPDIIPGNRAEHVNFRHVSDGSISQSGGVNVY